MADYAGPISVTYPVGRAIDHVKKMLFQPFDLGRWFVIGFCAWLAQLGEGGGFGSGFNYQRRHGNATSVREMLERARDYVMDNLQWIVPLAIFIILLSIALGVLITWLNSRGKFMFLHCVTTNRAEVQRPWNEYAAQGNSLFWFRLVLGLIASVPIAVFVIAMIFLIVRLSAEGAFGPLIIPLILTVLALIVFSLALFLVVKLTKDFVVPIMYLRRNTCLEAWKEFLTVLTLNLGNFILYLLFQIVLSLAIGAMVIVVILVTCCVAGCLLALPYIGTVLLLPVLVFSRAYSLFYFAQYGSPYDVFVDSPSVVS
jgi:hypothetical protein